MGKVTSHEGKSRKIMVRKNRARPSKTGGAKHLVFARSDLKSGLIKTWKR